jgi:hypothetical protein
MPKRGYHPVDWLRGIALSLERLAAQGVVSGAVRGASEELRAEVSEGRHAKTRTLFQDALALLDRVVGGAARSRVSPLVRWSHSVAEGATRGAFEETRRLVPELRPMTQDLLVHAKQWLDRSQSEAVARTHALRSPGELSRVTAAGAVAGAADQLGVALPALAHPAADLAEHVGRGVVRGAAEELGRQARAAARNPAVRVVAGGTAVTGAVAGIVAVLLLATRRR